MKLKHFIILFLSLILSACGFQLRSPATLAEHLDPIYLQGSTPTSPLEYYLHNRLLAAGAKLVDKPEQASLTLELEPPIFKRARLNASVDIQTRLYILSYSVNIQFTRFTEKKHLKLGSLTRSFYTSHNLVVGADSTLGATGQLEPALNGMQHEIVEKLLRFLQAEELNSK